MNSIATNQNNVNTALQELENAFLLQYPDLPAECSAEISSIEVQDDGLSSSLGIYTKSRNPFENEKVENKRKRSKKQRFAGKLVGGRISKCRRIPVMMVPENAGARIPDNLRALDILKNGENYSFGGLMSCGSVWACPVCASTITEFRRRELKQAHLNALAEGLSLSMLTLTVPHYAKDSLKDVLEGQKKALRKFKNSKAFKKIVKGIGLVGDVRTLEVTFGINGWHPHFHILWFTKSELSVRELNSIRQSLLSLWQKACVSSGLSCPNDHGVDLVDGTYASAYVSKWGIEEEMTKGHLKNGVKEGHVSPFGLLDLYGEGDLNAGRRFQEFAEEFKGKRQLVWSRGLRKLLKVENEISDDQIIIEEERKSEVFMKITYADYKKLLFYEKRDECLELCDQGKEAVQAFIDDLPPPLASDAAGASYYEYNQRFYC